MFQEEFNHIITDLANLQETDVSDVRTIADRYPYCQAAQIIYARKLHDVESPQFDSQLKRAATFAYDRNVLFNIIEKYQYGSPVAAGLEEEPELDIIEEPVAFIPLHVEEEKPVEQLYPKDEETLIEPHKEELPEPEPESEHTEPELNDQPVESAEETVIEEVVQNLSEQESNEILQAAIEDILELTEEPPEFNQPQEQLQEDEPIDPQEEVNEEAVFDTLEEEIAENAIDDELPELTVPPIEYLVEETMEETEPEDEGADALVEELMQLDPVEPEGDFVEEIALNIENDIIAPPESDIEEEEELIESDPEENDEEVFFDLPAYDIERELGALHDDELIKITIQRPVAEPEPAEMEASQADSFVGWLNRLGSTSKPVLVEMKASNRPIRVYKRSSTGNETSPASTGDKKVVNELIAAELARKSLTLDENIATETLARIMVMQGKYPKAIEMYERLSLLKPKKSDYFAALIDQLKKRMK